MMGEQEDKCRVEAAAVRMARYGTISTDEFNILYQDKEIRAKIRRKAWMCAHSREEEEDLWQEAWEEICKAPPHQNQETYLACALYRIHQLHTKRKRREDFWKKHLGYVTNI